MTSETKAEYLTRWYYRYPWTRVLTFLYCISSVFVGLIGLDTQPSPSMLRQLGYYAVLLYSSILIVSGIIGAIGIFRSVQATVVSLWAIAAATFFHGLAVFNDGSTQTGLRLMIAPLMMIPLAWSWKEWLMLVKHVSRLSLPEIIRHKRA